MSASVMQAAEGSVQRGVELLHTLDHLLAESAVEHSQHEGKRVRKLRLRTDLAEYITKTLMGLEVLSISQNNAKAQHTAENIQQRLEQVTSLHIYSPHSSLDLFYFKVSFYRALEELVLEDCPPSLAVDLYSLRRCLFKVSMVRSGITSLAEIFSPVKMSIRQALSPMILSESSMPSLSNKYVWQNVTTLVLSNCGLSRIDEALHFFPHLKYLNLSHNHIAHVTHLQDCIALQVLDLSFNKVRVLSNLERVLGKIRQLLLSHNEVESLDGIDKIYSLESIDLTHNLLNDVNEVDHLCRLPCLESISFAENPICERKHYRLRVYKEFLKVGSIMSGNRAFPSLDGRGIRRKELRKLRRLLFRAPTDAMIESSYATHAMDDFDLDTVDDDLLEDDLDDLSVNSSPVPSNSNRFAQVHGSRLSIGAVSPLAADAFRRLSSTRISQQPHSPSPLKRRSSMERGGARDRFRSSEYGTNRDSMYSTRDSPLSPALRMSLAIKRFHNRKQPSLSRRVAEIADGRTVAQSVDLKAIERDVKARPEVWKLAELPVEVPVVVPLPSPHVGSNRSGAGASLGTVSSSPPLTSQLISSSPLPGTSVLNSSILDLGAQQKQSPSGSTSPTAPHLSPRKEAPLSPSKRALSTTMDDFIGRIHDKTEFKSFNERGETVNDMTGPSDSVPHHSEVDNHAHHAHHHQQPHKHGSHPHDHATLMDKTPRESITSRLSDLPIEIQSHRQVSQDSVLLDVDPFVGDPQYRTLSVLDNLELYFREQVFPSNRPSFPNLYLRSKPTSSRDHSLNLVTPFAPEERFITLFFEKVIDLKDPTISINSGYNTIADAAGRTDIDEFIPNEAFLAIVLTDMGFYIVDVSDCHQKVVFADSPLLVVHKYHPLYKLSLCTIYFGFQRCALGFFEDPYNSDSRLVSDMQAAYMIVTRDKAHTYPLITRVPQVANIQRNARRPKALSNVRIENKDGQLLEQLSKHLGGLGDNDIIYYQMAHVVSSKRPGWQAPRSIVVTKSMFFLCKEDLSALDVRLIVVDSSHVKDVKRIQHEENPLYVTFIFKRSGVLSKQRKWRLVCDARTPATRLLEECKRACHDMLNVDV